MRTQSFFYRTRQQLVWFLVLLLVAATLMCVLNSTNIIRGSWTTALYALFSGSGVILALLQWWAQIQPTDLSVAGQQVHGEVVTTHSWAQYITRKRKGAIVVYTPRIWRGTPIHLVPGLQENAVSPTSIEAISTVVECRGTRPHVFVCSFPAVPPGHYTLMVPLKPRHVQITVRPGHLSEVDWR